MRASRQRAAACCVLCTVRARSSIHLSPLAWINACMAPGCTTTTLPLRVCTSATTYCPHPTSSHLPCARPVCFHVRALDACVAVVWPNRSGKGSEGAHKHIYGLMLAGFGYSQVRCVHLRVFLKCNQHALLRMDHQLVSSVSKRVAHQVSNASVKNWSNGKSPSSSPEFLQGE